MKQLNLQVNLRKKFTKKGVKMLAPETVFFSKDTIIGKNVTIDPYVVIGEKVKIQNNVKIYSFSHLEKVMIENNVSIGPYARLRPGVILRSGSRVGNFVEVKKSIIGKNSRSDDNREYAESILLFSLFIEHVSLFSQFLIIMGFNKHKNMLKGISNVVEATSKEEQIHGDFGIDLIKVLQKENPDWFTDEYHKRIQDMCLNAFEAEKDVVDWIFENGELDFLPKAVVNEFLKNRFNNSLESIGIEKVFDIDEDLVAQTEWFDDEIIGTKHGDFFVKRSINYSKRSQSITSDDLF